MCRGEEEEVKIFIDVHVHLVQIHTQVLNSDTTREENKRALLFLRFYQNVKTKRIYCLHLSYLSSSIFTPGKRTGMA